MEACTTGWQSSNPYDFYCWLVSKKPLPLKPHDRKPKPQIFRQLVMKPGHPDRCKSSNMFSSRLRLKCYGTCAETRFRLSAKRTSPFKSAGASVQSTTGSRGVRISGSNAVYTMFRGGVKSTDYPLHSPVSPSLPLPCVTVCHNISTGLCSPNGFMQGR